MKIVTDKFILQEIIIEILHALMFIVTTGMYNEVNDVYLNPTINYYEHSSTYLKCHLLIRTLLHRVNSFIIF